MTFSALKKLIAVMLPILVAQLSTVGMNFLDTAMSGHAGRADLAGVSVGASLFMPILVATTGVLAAATPMIAQLLGRKQPEEIPEVVRTGLYVGFVLALLFAGAYALGIDAVLGGMQLEPDVERIARYYLLAMAAAVFFETPVMVLRSLTDTVGGTAISMRLFLLGLPIDGALNWLFIFGHWGVPRMGGIGAGIATLLTYVILLALFLAVVFHDRRFRGRAVFGSFRTRLSVWREFLGIGVPNGLGMFMESSLFGFIVIFVARFGTEVLAAHQAAMNFSGVIYMLPLSCSMALTIVTGVEVGAGRYDRARTFRRAGLGWAVFCACLTAAATVALRGPIAGIYTEDAGVAQAAGLFLVYCAGWQCFDAVAAPIQGILRGYKDAKVPFMLMMAAYWGVCFPAGLALDHLCGHGAISYWQGLDIGVGCSALALAARLFFIERRHREGV